MNHASTFTIGYAVGVLVLGAILLGFHGCSSGVETTVKGDRSIVQVSSGKFADGNGNYRKFFIVRDEDTKVDYLVAIDAGIIKLEPKPRPEHRFFEEAPK